MRLSAIYDWLSAHRLIVDGVLAFLIFVSCMVFVFATNEGVAGAVLTCLMVPILTLRRARPVLTFTVVSLACVIQLLMGEGRFLYDIAFLIALYALAAHSDSRRLRVTGLGVAWLGSVLIAILNTPDVFGAVVPALLVAALSSSVWLAGDLVGHRRFVMARLREQNIVLARDQSQRERLAAQAERARIAREMHDIVAHNLSVIVVQADGAAYQASMDPVVAGTQSQRTLETIAETARSALAETRRLVGVLRTQDEEAEYRPTASLEDIDTLVERVVASGLQVTLHKRGTPRLVSPETGLAAYRIVQEALTNVMKHAGPYATAEVTVDYGSPLGVVVSDTGNGSAAGEVPGGNGIIGMRERVEAVGGSLHAGPDPTGGFRVSAYLMDPPRGAVAMSKGAA